MYYFTVDTKCPKELSDFFREVFEVYEIRGRVGEDNSVVFKIKSNEQNHALPHVHAEYAEYSIVTVQEWSTNPICMIEGELPAAQNVGDAVSQLRDLVDIFENGEDFKDVVTQIKVINDMPSVTRDVTGNETYTFRIYLSAGGNIVVDESGALVTTTTTTTITTTTTAPAETSTTSAETTTTSTKTTTESTTDASSDETTTEATTAE
jgi:hypothetical protein